MTRLSTHNKRAKRRHRATPVHARRPWIDPQKIEAAPSGRGRMRSKKKTAAFVRAQLRQVADGLGLSYAALTADYHRLPQP